MIGKKSHFEAVCGSRIQVKKKKKRKTQKILDQNTGIHPFNNPINYMPGRVLSSVGPSGSSQLSEGDMQIYWEPNIMIKVSLWVVTNCHHIDGSL